MLNDNKSLDEYGYTYDNGTLINKLDIKNDEILEYVEVQNTYYELLNIRKLHITKFNKKTYLEIHKYLFNDVYSFAGKIRVTNIAKDNTLFCQYHLINKSLNDVFKKFEKEVINSKEDLVKAIAYYYAELNMIHAFREGNGRTNRIFFELYAKNKGYDLDFSKVNMDDFLNATIYSSINDESKLIKILNDCINLIK